MELDILCDLARTGRLYPSLILHGGDFERRRDAALRLARILLAAERRVTWPDDGSVFHPDFHVLQRDLRTATSAAATKSFLANAYSAPFEAPGQVFVIAEADTLGGEAADALLKLLEEPPESSPRNFLLLAASRLDLSPTLRSRSLSFFLGAAEALDEARVDAVATRFGAALADFAASGAAVHLLRAADALGEAGGWEDARARGPWALVATAVVRHLHGGAAAAHRRPLLAFAEALLDAPRLRVRGITHGRILEGLLSRHLAEAASHGRPLRGNL